ncbi:MAG TPA: NrfD/PsrC family molybdoenzyme membrane anchor subunit [Ktedonobacteraceae bacterium]|jgi:formate-dependent nitrite reductase membrane component NrfD
MDTDTNHVSITTGGASLSSLSTESAVSSSRQKGWVGEAATYYHAPLIKRAHWTWEIILYFFLGGLAGGSFLVATIAHLFGSTKDAPLVRAGRYLAFGSISLSPFLLIKDLGRPARFHHMLRILKFRSVMSIGSWAISFFGLFCGLATVYQMANDGLFNWFPRLARFCKSLPIKAIEVPGALFGLLVGSYTGVLLSSTAVPLWARARYVLGPLFLTSGLSTALSALSLILSTGRSRQETFARLERAEMLTMTAEIGLSATLPSQLRALKQPLYQGKPGLLYNGGSVGAGLILPLLLKLFTTKKGQPVSRKQRVLTSSLVLVGGLALRASWIMAGRISADTPEATHIYNAMEQQKNV